MMINLQMDQVDTELFYISAKIKKDGYEWIVMWTDIQKKPRAYLQVAFNMVYGQSIHFH